MNDSRRHVHRGDASSRQVVHRRQSCHRDWSSWHYAFRGPCPGDHRSRACDAARWSCGSASGRSARAIITGRSAEKAFDQAALDAEGFGDKKVLAREADGLRVTLKPGEAEAGWKTPQQLRIGGDCTITATLVIRKLPKPAREDGAAIGIAVATQNIDQPEATLLRELEPDGKDVYRPIEKAAAGQQMMSRPMMMRRRMVQSLRQPGPRSRPSRSGTPSRRGGRRSAWNSAARARASASRSSTRWPRSPARSARSSSARPTSRG